MSGVNDPEPAVSRGVALVTGGSRGIGASVCVSLAGRGWDVCLTYRSDEDAAKAVAGRIEALGRRSVIARADVAAEPDVVAAFGAAHDLGPLTAVVANAGIVGAKTRVAELDVERIHRMLAVNVTGVLLTCREAVRRMSTAHGGQGGSIVLVSSAAARLGAPGEYVDYAASKGAVDTIGIGLAKEVAAEGVRVNVVRPGVVDTEIHASGGRPDRAREVGPTVPLGRAGTADEVAAAVSWFAGPESGYCTGSILDVAGGR